MRRRRWINRGPRPLFLGLSACTIIRGRELGELSTAQLTQPGFFSDPVLTLRLRECIWRACLDADGMARNGRGAGAEEMGSAHSCPEIPAAFGLPIPVALAAFYPVLTCIVPSFTFHCVRRRLVQGDRVAWQEELGWGSARSGFCPTSSLGLVLHACRMGIVYFMVMWMIRDHLCWVPGIWKAFKKYQSHPPLFLHSCLQGRLWYDSQLNTQLESVPWMCSVSSWLSDLFDPAALLTAVVLPQILPQLVPMHHLSLSSNFKTLSWPEGNPWLVPF